jgi:hypothetical protein
LRGDKSPPPTPPEEGKIFLRLHPKLIFAVLGLVGKGSFSLPNVGDSSLFRNDRQEEY